MLGPIMQDALSVIAKDAIGKINYHHRYARYAALGMWCSGGMAAIQLIDFYHGEPMGMLAAGGLMLTNLMVTVIWWKARKMNLYLAGRLIMILTAAKRFAACTDEDEDRLREEFLQLLRGD